MEETDIIQVVEGWKGIYVDEGKMLRETAENGAEDAGYVQIFEVSTCALVSMCPCVIEV